MKKVFAILSIVLILFVSILPAFAEKPGYYNQQFKSFDYLHTVGTSTFTRYDDYYSVNLSAPYYNNGVYFSAISSQPIDHYFIYVLILEFTSDYTLPLFTDYLSNNRNPLYRYDGSVFYGIEQCRSSTTNLYLILNSYPSSTVTFNLFSVSVVDLTLIYGDSASTVTASQFFSDYPLFLDPVPFTQSSVYVGSYYHPLLEFFGNFSHVFDFVPGLFNNSMVGLTIFVSSLLFVIFMIFLVVLVIRRCRNI